MRQPKLLQPNPATETCNEPIRLFSTVFSSLLENNASMRFDRGSEAGPAVRSKTEPEDASGGLFDSNDHGVRANQVFDAGIAEACFFHPTNTIRAGIIKPARRFDQLVQAHEETEGVFRPVVVDQSVVNNQRAAARNRFISLADQQPL